WRLGFVWTWQPPHQQLVDWGWRFPYVFGLLVGPAGFYIRSRMAETPEFLNAEKPQRMPISELLRRQAGLGPAGARRRRDLEQLPITCCSTSRPTGSRRCICPPIPPWPSRWSVASSSPSSRSLLDTIRTGPSRVRG